MNKETVVRKYNGVSLSHKIENAAFGNNMDGPRGHYAKRCKSQKDKYCLISLVCGIPKSQTCENRRERGYWGWGRKGRTGERWFQGRNLQLVHQS